jgi:hypothetical protein
MATRGPEVDEVGGHVAGDESHAALQRFKQRAADVAAAVGQGREREDDARWRLDMLQKAMHAWVGEDTSERIGWVAANRLRREAGKAVSRAVSSMNKADHWFEASATQLRRLGASDMTLAHLRVVARMVVADIGAAEVSKYVNARRNTEGGGR